MQTSAHHEALSQYCQQPNPPIVEQLEFGTNTIGTPRRLPEGGSWERVDLYTSHESGDVTPERRFAAGRDDFSPMARTMYAGSGNCTYHPKCSCCWLGFSHTLALHQREAVGSWD